MRWKIGHHHPPNSHFRAARSRAHRWQRWAIRRG